MIKLIVFDCWGTLFTSSQRPHPFAVFAEKLGHDVADRAYLKQFEAHIMLDADDVGTHIRSLLQALRIEVTTELVGELQDILLGSIAAQAPYPETVRVLDNLTGTYRLALLSNTFVEGFTELRRKYPIEKWFELEVLSFEKHMIKPDIGLYNFIVETSSLQRDEILMVGDNYYDDVVAATEAGLSAVLLDRRNRYPDIADRKINNLDELVAYLS